MKRENANYWHIILFHGISELDDIATGFYRGGLNIIASRPGMGNTPMLTSLAFFARLKSLKTLFLTLQHSSNQILERFIHLSTEHKLSYREYASINKRTAAINRTLKIFDLEIEDQLEEFEKYAFSTYEFVVVDCRSLDIYNYLKIVAKKMIYQLYALTHWRKVLKKFVEICDLA